ncbi:hypothetical protein JB92DRAFT_3038603 [Gautieria morchelliformis]|nr:hypothetical protein JB92DRAFT_3038603 [Gautieria morchelliformis]
MASESKRPSSSHKHWTLNWWDLWPLVDGERRPVQWTDSSMIFSSHPSSPIVVARAFPSSAPFTLPSPIPVLNNPGGFSSPKIIQVSSGDEYVFAFFEGRGGEHAACIWSQEESRDNWKVSIHWQIRLGQGIVLAKWLDGERTWMHTAPPSRSPPLGPPNPFGKPTLLLVTQGHVVQIVHRSSLSMQFQLVSASLRHASLAHVSDRPTAGETTNGPGGLLVCRKAAVGLGYGESTIIIATCSTLIPPTSSSNPEFPDHFGVPTPSIHPSIASLGSWESYGPEQAIHLCEIRITSFNFIMGVATKPLPPLFPQVTSSSHLSDILILPHLTVEEPSSPDGSAVDNVSSKNSRRFKTLMRVVLSYLDFEDYLSPKSDIMCFEIQRGKGSPTESSKPVTWSHRHLHTRTITNAAVSFLLPSRNPSSDAIVAGVLDTEGLTPRSSAGEGKSKEIHIGKIIRLRLPNLIDDEDWEPSRLMARPDDAGTNPPISAAISPLESFICTSPAPWSSALRLSVHALPSQKNFTVTALSESLLLSILSNRPPTDVVHVLANPTFPLSSVHVVLEDTFDALDSGDLSAQDWRWQVAGIMLDIYRTRLERLCNETPTDEKEQISMDERWHIALDICTVRALKSAFDACKEGHGYDLDPVWQLISLISWLVDFAERLVRTCVLWEGSLALHNSRSATEPSQDKTQDIQVKMEAMEVDRDDLFDGELSPAPDAFAYSAPPSLIHIIHPYLLDNLIGAISHLNAFRAYLDTLLPSKLKAGIAKELALDFIDCSGIDFKELESALRKISQLEEFTALDAGTLRRSFCLLSPLPTTQGLLMEACSLITSPTTVSKPRLFIKPSDLVDGISKLNLERGKMNKVRDVVSKGVLGTPGSARTCTRCGGKTEVGRTPLPRRANDITDIGSWAAWEHGWKACICGGLWMKGKAR